MHSKPPLPPTPRSKPKAKLTAEDLARLQRDAEICKDDERIVALREKKKEKAMLIGDDSSDEELDDSYQTVDGLVLTGK